MPSANSTRKQWSNSGLDLFLDLEAGRGGGRGLRASIEEGLREAIRSGRLARGTRLPPTRALARDLGVSRGTVLQAYAQLSAEGWIRGRRGSATVVAYGGGGARQGSGPADPGPTRWRWDFRPGRPDPGSFPRREWLRALRRVFASAPNDAFGYGDPRGDPGLRAELASYLARARGLRVAPEHLMITSGFTQSLGLVARALASLGVRRVVVERPGMPLHREILRAAGHALVPVDVDDDGVRVGALGGAADVGAAVLTPNRQHPTGAMLSAARRSQLLDWARARGAVVVEDDYDGEFRYDGRPIGPLQGLDPGVVVYAGTASKTLAPGLRLGWLALPERLRAPVVREKRLADWHSSALEQLAFAELLRSGAYDRHIRRMRLRYRRRRDVLLRALAGLDPPPSVLGATAGLNLLIPLPDADREAAALAAARAAGIGLEGLAAAGHYDDGGGAGLIIGYAAVRERGFGRAVSALVKAIEGPVRG